MLMSDARLDLLSAWGHCCNVFIDILMEVGDFRSALSNQFSRAVGKHCCHGDIGVVQHLREPDTLIIRYQLQLTAYNLSVQ